MQAAKETDVADNGDSSLGNLLEEARKHVLREIPQLSGTGKSHRVLQLAEAYAWLSAPSQPHGAGGSSE